MRYLWAIIWGFLLSNMMFYVLASMQGGHYEFGSASLFGVILAVAATLLGEGLISEPAEQ
ncbi:YjzD family protein [Guptibacillus hwajinpoensis]|uniref:YjzD family protein n=1 Tax=Guptibacillus hwajinpoensis TaxID=208199 RepID=UPI00384D3914